MKDITKNEINAFFDAYEALDGQKQQILNAIETIVVAYSNGKKVLCCGNGGSSADSDHIVGELMKSFKKKRPVGEAFAKKAKEMFGEEGEKLACGLEQGLPAISLTAQTALMTAFLNDCGSEYLFAQQVNALGKEGDVLIAISTSGNSKNVIHAIRVAILKNMKIIVLTGGTGGKMKDMVENVIVSSQSETYKIQEEHLPIYHLICASVENELF